jgi:hypothetical protein
MMVCSSAVVLQYIIVDVLGSDMIIGCKGFVFVDCLRV